MNKDNKETVKLWAEILGGAVVGFAAAAGVWQGSLYLLTTPAVTAASLGGGGEASSSNSNGNGKWYVGDPTAEPQPVPGYNPYVQYRAPDTNPCSNGRVWTEWCGCQSPQYGGDC